MMAPKKRFVRPPSEERKGGGCGQREERHAKAARLEIGELEESEAAAYMVLKPSSPLGTPPRL